jgi:hypothetical protein
MDISPSILQLFPESASRQIQAHWNSGQFAIHRSASDGMFHVAWPVGTTIDASEWKEIL